MNENIETEMDPELLKAFRDEINGIIKEVEPLVKLLTANADQPKIIEQCGQIIDRIYGTASTMGYKDLGEYAKVLKLLCYKCSQSTNLYAKGQARDFVNIFIKNIERFCAALDNPKELRKYRTLIINEVDRANGVIKKILGTIKRGSTAA
jgi:chemotaxis protein histidine kinase CheA